MASPAHELGVRFLRGSDDGPDEYSLPQLAIEKSDGDCTRQVWSDMSAAEQVDPSAFKPEVQIEPSEEVPVGSKFLSMSDGAQASRRKAWSKVRGRIGHCSSQGSGSVAEP